MEFDSEIEYYKKLFSIFIGIFHIFQWYFVPFKINVRYFVYDIFIETNAEMEKKKLKLFPKSLLWSISTSCTSYTHMA